MTGKQEAGALRRYGRARRVAELLDVSISTIWRWSLEGVIPPPHRIGPTARAWDLDEVLAAIDRNRTQTHDARGRAGGRGVTPQPAGDDPTRVRIEVVPEAEAGCNLLPELDAVLVGFIALDGIAASVITEDWIEAPKWQRVARALLRHRAKGGVLGDLIIAAQVLEAAGIDFAATTAAEAIMATAEVVNAQHVVEHARRRVPRLRLRRLAQLLVTTASSDPITMVSICRGIAARTLEQIAEEAQP